MPPMSKPSTVGQRTAIPSQSTSNTNPIPNPAFAWGFDHGFETSDDDSNEEQVEEQVEEQDGRSDTGGSQADGIAMDIAARADPEADMQTPNDMYGHTVVDRVSHLRSIAENETSKRNTLLEEPEKLPWGQTYGSNEDVYNPNQPYSIREYVAQGIAAGRMRPSNIPNISQQSPRRTNLRIDEGDIVRGISIEPLIVGPRELEHRLAGATMRVHDRQRLLLEANHSRPSTSIGVRAFQGPLRTVGVWRRWKGPKGPGPNGIQASQEPEQGVVSSTPLWSKKLGFSSPPSESIPPAASTSNDARRSFINQPFLPLGFGTSELVTDERSSPAIAGVRFDDDSNAVQRKPALEMPENPYTPKPRKRNSALAVAITTRESDSLSAPSTAPPQGNVHSRPCRKRRRSAVSPQDAVPPPPSPGISQGRRTRRPFHSPDLLQSEDFEMESPSGSQVIAGASRFLDLSQIDGDASLQANAVSWLNAALDEPEVVRPVDYVSTLNRLPEAIRLRVYEQLGRRHGLGTPKTQPNSFLPSMRDYRTRQIFFTSELLPRTFSPQKRLDILEIFRTRAPFVPACISAIPGKPKVQYHVTSSRQESNRPPLAMSPAMSDQDGPLKMVPVEIFETIAQYCSHDTLKKMRLVNRDFEKKLSNRVFGTAVVPFSQGIYGMMVHTDPAQRPIDIKGKGEARGEF